MQHFELKGQTRQVGNKAVVKAIRKQGLIPCNLYGNNTENIIFTVSEKDVKGLIYTPNSYIVDIELDGKKHFAVLHELQFHPVKDNCLHIDFLAVDEKKPISIDVPIVITGHAIGVQRGGKFFQNARKLKISAEMKNLPDTLPVDVTALGLDKKIKASDIKIDGIKVISDKDTVICGVLSTRNSTAASEEAAE